MAKNPIWKPRFVKWREGRPRFEPGPRERRLGFRAEDLRYGPEGAWFTMEETRAWAEEKLAQIVAGRNGQELTPPPAWKSGTVGDLLSAYLESRDFTTLAEKTQLDQTRFASYIMFEKDMNAKKGMKSITAKRTVFSRAPVRIIDAADVKSFFERLERERGLAMARAIIMLLSAAWSWARTSPGWRLTVNPCHRLDLRMPEPRVFVWTETMIARFVAAADHLRLPEIGDCVYLGLFTAQRLADRLELVDNGLIGGARTFRQNKTGAVVMIPETAELAARIKAAKARRATLPHKVLDNTIIINEAVGRSFLPRHYNTVFNRVKAAAVAGILRPGTNEWIVEPCPELAQARDQDLRDTAVTWLALADCTLMQIASITGHSIASIQTTIRHYLAMDPRLAGAAMGKLRNWMDKEGMKL